jgi:CRP-like cAMP-binding protein
MDKLLQILNQFMPLSPELISELSACIFTRKTKKGEIIVSEGDVCDYIFFIAKGSLRGFYFHEGREITSWIEFENDFSSATYSFVTRKPGFENIESTENSILYVISYNDLNRIYKNHPEFNYIGRLLTEKYYVGLMERTICLQYQTATERYEQLVSNQPYMLQRASLGHIASYLGISQETLSRIRKKK